MDHPFSLLVYYYIPVSFLLSKSLALFLLSPFILSIFFPLIPHLYCASFSCSFLLCLTRLYWIFDTYFKNYAKNQSRQSVLTTMEALLPYFTTCRLHEPSFLSSCILLLPTFFLLSISLFFLLLSLSVFYFLYFFALLLSVSYTVPLFPLLFFGGSDPFT